MKSATISLASFKRAAASHQRTDRSSKASNAPRQSEDSSFLARAIIVDQAVTQRQIHRRRIIEEIISTEEGYLADIRFLMNVYVTFMAVVPTLPSKLKSTIKGNLNEILELHEQILGDLHNAVPHSEYTQPEIAAKPSHNRWRSLDAAPTFFRTPQKSIGMTADPAIAAAVARAFGQRLNRFFVYEEYGAQYGELWTNTINTIHSFH
jgi:hypothetical protein